MPVVVFVLAGILLNLFFPTQHLRAQNYNKQWSSTDDFNTGTNSNIDTANDEAKLATSTTDFNEGFTNGTYKDAATDANWDTTAHKLNLPGDPTSGVATDLQAKWKATVGVSDAVNATAYDATNGYLYCGGNNTEFIAYNINSGVYIDLKSKLGGWSNPIISMVIDPLNHFLYIGGYPGSTSYIFGALTLNANPLDSIFTNLSSKISSNWSSSNVFDIILDSDNHIVYLCGQQGKIGAFNGGGDPANGTWTYLNSLISADWTTYSIYAGVFDSFNHFLYIIGENGNLGAIRVDGVPANDTWVFLRSKITSDLGSYRTMAYDPTNKIVYFGGDNFNAHAELGAFIGGSNPATGTYIDWRAKMPYPLDNRSVQGLSYDTTNQKLYISSGWGSRTFGVFTGGDNPANAATGLDLTSKIPTSWTSSSIGRLTFCSTNSSIAIITGRYSASFAGNTGYFIGGGDPSNGSFTDISSTIAEVFQGYDILSSAYDSTNGFLYVSGASGKFMSYKLSDGTAVDLTSKISADWSTRPIRSLVYDSYNHKIYLGGGQSGSGTANFGVFTGGNDPATGSWVFLQSKISADYNIRQIDTLAYDSEHHVIYMGAGYGIRLSAFVPGDNPANGTYINLTSKISLWNWGYIKTLCYDAENSYIYVGGQGEGGSTINFGVITAEADPNNAVWTNLFSKISAYWGYGDYIYASTFDTANNILYIGGASGKIGAFSGGDDPGNGSFTYLTTQLSSPDFDNASYWSTTNITSLSFAAGKIFFGGASGKFGCLTASATPGSVTTWNYLYSNISSINSTNQLNTMTYNASQATIYIGSVTGKFTSFLIGYATNKSGISTAIDGTTQKIFKATLTATATVPANTTVTYYLTNDGGAHWYAVSSGSEYTFSTATSDLRWKAYLTTSDASITPEITAVAVSYKYFTADSGTMSLVYDATQTVVPTALSWNSSLPANTTLTFKIRSAATQVGLASADWSDTKDNADTPVNLKTINVGGSSGVAENQFSEVYVILATSDGLSTPVLSDLTEQYVINEAPELQTVTATQATDGSKIVNIGYQLKDSDTHTNPYNQDQVALSYKYSIDNGDNWLDCSTITNTGLQSVNTNNTWKSFSSSWNIGTDLADSYYNNTVKVKVLANDNEQAHNTAEIISSAFSIDTKNPTTGAISGGGVGIKVNDGSSWTNNPTVDLTLSSADDTTEYMEIRNDNSFTASKEVYATSKTGWALSATDGNKTVYVRFYDAMGNYTDASFNVLLDTTAPDMPTHFTLFDGSDMQAGSYQIIAVWNRINDPSDFSQYILERRSDAPGSTWTELATFTNIASDVYSDKGLDHDLTYSYRLRDKDIHNNYSSYTDTKSLKPAGVDTVPPEITGTGPTPEAQDTTATISWTTDKPSDSYVEYGTTTNYGQIQGTDDLVVNHVVHLVGLNPTTTYQFRVKCRDASGNRVVSSNASFTTTLPAESEAGVNITGSTAQKPGADPEEVTIIWTTDKYATSQVFYGTNEASLDMHTSEDITLNKAHFVGITHLNPNTKYYYKAYSKDTYDNEVWGELKYFVTAQSGLSTPTIIKVQATDTTMTSSIISWQTTTVATSVVELGTVAGTYDQHIEDLSTGATTQHVVRLSDLDSGREYHYRVLGKGTDERWVASDDYVVATVPIPVISNLSVTEVKPDGASITWKTNSPTDSYIDFGVDKLDASQGKSELVTDHSVTLSAQKPATTYQVIAKSRDAYGNSTSSERVSFTTTADVTAPKIDNLRSEMTLITDESGNSRVQAIVSWATDEPATTLLRYSEGVAVNGNYTNTTQEDPSLVTTHLVVLNNLKPSMTYHMQAASKDSSNNTTISKDYTVLTKRQEKSLLQTVLAELENSFGWVKKIKLF